MTGSICDYFAGETIVAYCDPTIPWTGISKGFWRQRWDHISQDF